MKRSVELKFEMEMRGDAMMSVNQRGLGFFTNNQPDYDTFSDTISSADLPNNASA